MCVFVRGLKKLSAMLLCFALLPAALPLAQVQMGTGTCVAAFRDAAVAAVWGFACTEAMLDMDW